MPLANAKRLGFQFTVNQDNSNMPFEPLDDLPPTPSENLRYFTNRTDELDVFNRLLSAPAGEPLPVLMFYGVGGCGKTWLLRKLREKTAQLKIPNAFLDLDTRTGTHIGRQDKAGRLAEMRRQLGKRLECPRFDLAHAWLRAHQGDTEDPAFRGSTSLGILLEFCVVLVKEIPGGSVATWIADKLSGPLRKKLADSPISDWLASINGEQHYLRLRHATADEIVANLHRYLLLDLRDSLPERGSFQCRAVVFIDTIESLSDVNQAVHAQLSAQKWIRDLYSPESPLQIILAGRDHLHWGDIADSDFADERYLEHHLIGGLSEPDAIEFLSRCDIVDSELQQAILRVCRDAETGRHAAATVDHSPADGHHPWALGLAADAVCNLRGRGIEAKASEFDFDPGDVKQLANRFLQSMGSDRSYEIWLKRLALPPRFDAQAAKHAFFGVPERCRRRRMGVALRLQLCDRNASPWLAQDASQNAVGLARIGWQHAAR